jgi:hypothetical protein
MPSSLDYKLELIIYSQIIEDTKRKNNNSTAEKCGKCHFNHMSNLYLTSDVPLITTDCIPDMI